MNLNHFRLLRVVGKGAFGKVRIVERKDTGLTFALKYIRKEEGMLEQKELMDGKNYRLTVLTRQWFDQRAYGILSGKGGCWSI